MSESGGFTLNAESILRVISQPAAQQVVNGALLIWLVFILANLTLALLPGDSSTNTAVALPSKVIGQAPTSPSADIDINALRELNLFGSADPKVQAEVVKPVEPSIEDNAAKTRLNLRLMGLVVSDNAEESVAMIVARNKEEQFAVGDKIPEGNNTTLAKVLFDRVIINNAGRYESLWLYDESNKSSRPASPAPKSTGNTSRARDLAKNYRERVYNNPRSLAEVIRITPQQKDGQLIGYRISPGRDKDQFTELGFKNGDIVTTVNSISLTEPSKALEVYKIMRTAKEASFEILRNEEALQIVVDLQ